MSLTMLGYSGSGTPTQAEILSQNAGIIPTLSTVQSVDQASGLTGAALQSAIINNVPVASVVATNAKTGMSQTEKIIFLLVAVLVALKLLKVI